MVISMVVGVDVIVNVGVVDIADNPVVIVVVGVLDAGLVIIPGVIVTVGAALAVLHLKNKLTIPGMGST
jgi:hypothetical protein